LSVRWVASSFRTVRSVWLSYEALHLHFTRKSSDPLTESREKARFAGLAKKLESGTFIKNLGLMHDALEELSDLSLALQRVDISLPVANKLVGRQVEVFVLPERHLIPCIIKRHVMQLNVVYLESS